MLRNRQSEGKKMDKASQGHIYLNFYNIYLSHKVRRV